MGSNGKGTGIWGAGNGGREQGIWGGRRQTAELPGGGSSRQKVGPGGAGGGAGMARRGPRGGDPVSLWNFTPSPGWSRAEALALKQSLVKFGVGRWQEILQSGVLPGKTIQQMNCQTQRLLGQQSLAAYTGLRVDIDRIRADNVARCNVERKNGLLINSGPNPTPAMRRRWQAEAQAKYGLLEQQVAEACEALETLAAELAAARGQGGRPDAGALGGGAETLLTVDAESLSDQDRGKLVQMLQAYVNSLQDLVRGLGKAEDASAPRGLGCGASNAGGCTTKSAKTTEPTESAHPKQGTVGKRLRPAGDGDAQRQKSARPAPAKAVLGQVQDLEAGARMRPVAGAQRHGAGKSGEIAAKLPPAEGGDISTFKKDQLQQIVDMGFSKATARKALEKHGYDVEAAVHWIVVNM